MSWHVLDVGSIWVKEFASELRQLVPTRGWLPQIRNFGWLEHWEQDEKLSDPPLDVTRFPLQRGYRRVRFSRSDWFWARETARILSRESDAKAAVLVCTAPFYAPLAERWPGTVVYYLTDLTAAYRGMNAAQIKALDRRMCRAARVICPNSERIGDYLRREANCSAEKITVIPNATREASVLLSPLLQPASPPADIADLPRPIVGVIGNLSDNMDWLLLAEAIGRAPTFSWVFVGPTEMGIPDAAHRQARGELMARGGRVRFTGGKSYGALSAYARAFDIALLPYLRHEPTFSGSPTRFYEHLAACRPMVATRGMEQLMHKEPLVSLVNTAAEIAAKLECIRSHGSGDGFEELRWRASLHETWHARAYAMVRALRDSDSVQKACATGA
jgi:glycosyltransferase involved in cell wall biosynthesis